MDLSAAFLFTSDLNNESLFLEKPIHRIFTKDFSGVKKALSEIDNWTNKKKYHLAGFVSYEVGYALMDIDPPSHSTEQSLVDFYVFEGTSQCAWQANHQVGFYNFSQPPSFSSYDHSFNKIKMELTSGNTYQVNFTIRGQCSSWGDPYSLFLKLLQAQESKYAVCAQLEDLDILSVSPELFFSKVENKIIVKPMKGTLPLEIQKFSLDLKDKLTAENLMIVDLLRNDLAKIADPSTVEVVDLMRIEDYKTLRQMVSTVQGQVSREIHFSKVLQGLFPCGSITGAPKRRTMEILRQLEDSERGVYTGTIGFITPQNNMQFNVAIRTLVGQQNHWSYGVGGGIVLDSVPSEEYQEALLKSQFIRSANSHFSIFETMLFDKTKVLDLEEHLARLESSAQIFGFKVNVEEIKNAVLKATVSLLTKTRLKLELFVDGTVKIHQHELIEDTASRRVTFSAQVVNSKNVFYKHKTSLRDVYDSEYLYHRNRDFYDVLFLNEENEVTEASRHNLFIKSGDQWRTPALRCGLLAGVERGKWIKKTKALEVSLSKKDVIDADEVWLTNSVRGGERVDVVL